MKFLKDKDLEMKRKCLAHPGYAGDSYAPGTPCVACQELFDHHHGGSFSKARAVIVEEFKDRELGGTRHTYLANIAMLLHDRFEVPVPIANLQADEILDLCFGE